MRKGTIHRDGFAIFRKYMWHMDGTKTKSHKDASMNKTKKGKRANLEEKSPKKGTISDRDKQINKHDNSPTSEKNERGKTVKGEKTNLAATVKNGNMVSSSGGNISERSSPQEGAQSTSKKDAMHQESRKKKKDNLQGENKCKKLSDESREKYEKDIADIINNYNMNAKFYYENLKNKILVYKNMKYKLMHIYEPVVIDYDEQATVIYKKDDIYNSKENNMSEFVNNVYH